jgi:glycosyltransferase involved in cell wall biosynthesis
VIVWWSAPTLFGVVAWNVLRWRKVGNAPTVRPGNVRPKGARGSIAILIPARDEEDRLPACLQSLMGQDVAEILVYDDHSEDSTAAVIDRFARRDARFRRLAPAPLPSGWCGKTFACAQMAAQATSDWLLFLDADVRLAPGAAARIAAEAESASVTLLSCWPGFDIRGFWEAVLMPMLNFVVFTLFPAPLAAERGDASLGIAHGACILARRDVYTRLGGHAMVRGEIFEDTLLARAWRAGGERSLMLDGQHVVRVRMYSGYSTIWRGFEKNFYPAFRKKRNFWLFLAMHAGVFLLPFLMMDYSTMALVLGARTLLAVRFRQAWWSVALHPLGEAVVIALGFSSWWKCRSGQGVAWKRRVVGA